MPYGDWIVASASVVTAVATVVIAWYAVVSHELAQANQRLAEAIGRSQQQMGERHEQALQHLAAATLAAGPFGTGAPDAAQKCYKTHLQAIRDQINSETTVRA